MDVKEIVYDSLVFALGVEYDKINTTDTIRDKLGADSLDCVEICMDIEEKFDIEITDDDLLTIKTVGDLVNLIIALRAKKGN